MLKDFKILTSFFFVFMFIQATSFANGYEPAQKDITTLSDWSNLCFKELVEHSSDLF